MCICFFDLSNSARSPFLTRGSAEIFGVSVLNSICREKKLYTYTFLCFL